MRPVERGLINNDSSVVVIYDIPIKPSKDQAHAFKTKTTHIMEHQYFIGIDRSDTTIDICKLDKAGITIEQDKIPSAPESLILWVKKLLLQIKEQDTIALCIEQPCQNLVNFFSQFSQLALYLENPSVIKKYRESLSASRAKDDKRDAAAIAQYIFERHQRLESYSNSDPLCSQISTLVEKRRQLVSIRTSPCA